VAWRYIDLNKWYIFWTHWQLASSSHVRECWNGLANNGDVKARAHVAYRYR
jgi:hypothetical protein